MSRTRRAGWRAGATCWAVGLLVAAAAVAAENAPGEPPADEAFRRLLVPAERIADWPRPAGRYVPLERQEFEALVAAARPGRSAGRPAAGIRDSVYRARWHQGALRGRATCEVVLTEDGPRLLSLAPSNLAWHGVRHAAAPHDELVWGSTPQGPAVLVAGSTTLELDWSLERPAGDLAATPWLFTPPPAGSTRCELTLPKEWTPDFGPGAVVESRPGDEPDTRLWVVYLDGRGSWTWRWSVPFGPAVAPPELGWRQALTYTLEPSRVGVQGRWELPAALAAPPEIAIELDRAWRLGRVQAAGRDVNVTPEDTPEGPRRLRLPLEPSAAGVATTITVEGEAPPLVGSRETLPELRLISPGWQQGTVRLVVREPLVLDDLDLGLSRIVRQGPLPEADAGEFWELETFEPSAGVRVRLASRPRPLVAHTAARLAFSATGVEAHWRAAVRADDGARHLLEARVAHPWLVDGVTSVPADLVARWQVDTLDEASRRLRIRLSRPLPSGESVEIQVRARLLRSTHEPLDLEQLSSCALLGAEPSREALALLADGEGRLRFSGSVEAHRLARETLPAEQRALLADAPGALVCTAEPLDEPLRCQWEPRPRWVGGSVRVSLRSGPAEWRERLVVEAQVGERPASRLWVGLSRRRRADLRWSLAPADTPLAARRLDEQAQTAAGWGGVPEVWEIDLPEAPAGPVVVVAERSLAADEHEVALAALAGPASGPGRIRLEAAPGWSLTLAADAGEAIADLAPAPAGVSGEYLYDATLVWSGAGPAVACRLLPAAEALAPGRVGWARLESGFTRQGLERHRVRYWLEPGASAEFTWSLPQGSQLDQVRIDDRAIRPAREGAAWRVELPRLGQPALCEIEFSRGETGGWSGWKWPLRTVRPAWPRLPWPVGQYEWLVRLPPGCQVVHAPSTPLPGAGPDEWSQRLLGPLGRAREEPRWSPFGSSRGRTPDESTTIGASRRTWIEIARQTTPAGSSSALRQADEARWGPLISQVANQLDAEGFNLWVDRWALAEAELWPQTPWRQPRSQGSAGDEAGFWQAAGLVLVEFADGLWLTSPTAWPAIVRRGEPTPLAGAYRWFDEPGRLGSSEPLQSANPPRFVLASEWAGQPGWLSERTPPAAPSAPTASEERPIWMEFDAAAVQGRLWIVAQPTLWAAAWCAGFLGAGLALSLALRRSRWAERGLVVLVGLTWLAPPPLVPLTAGLVCGWLSGWVGARLPLFTRRTIVEPERNDAPSTERLAPVGLALLVLGGIGWALARPAPAAGDELPGVYVPVDRDGHPTDDPVQVPELLFQRLDERARAAWAWRGTIVRQASYELRFAGDPGGPVAPAELTARLTVWLAERGNRVRLGFSSAHLSLVDGEARVDGQPSPATWVDDGRALELLVPGPGEHLCELTFRCENVSAATSGRVALGVPPAAGAQLRVVPLEPGLLVSLPTALASPVVDDSAGRTVPLLGQAPLAVAWRGVSAREATGRVDQFRWLRVQPGAVSLAARWHFQLAPGSPRRFIWHLDPVLARRPLTVVGRADVSLEPSAQGEGLPVELELPAELGDDVWLEGLWPWPEASGVGHWELPRAEIRDVAGRQALALSVDPQLEYQLAAPDAARPLTAAEFRQLWGETSLPIEVAAEGGTFASWQLRTRPRAIVWRVTTDTLLALGPRVWQARTRISLESPAGGTFQHRLRLEPGWDIQELAVREGDQPLAARWAPGKPGEWNVFLAAPAAPRQQLEIVARAPAPSSGGVDWSPPEYLGGEAVAHALTIRRHPAVLVAVEQSAGWTTAASQPVAAALRRVVASLAASGQPGPVRLSTSANPGEGSLQTVSTWRQRDREWAIELGWQLTTTAGQIDELRWELPPGWQPGGQPWPAGARLVPAATDPERQVLVCDMPLAARGNWVASLSFRRARTEAESLEFVPPRLQSELPGEQLLLLPADDAAGAFVYRTRGLEPAGLGEVPDTLAPEGDSAESFQVFRARGSEPVAKLEPRRAGAAARVRLVEVAVRFPTTNAPSGLVTWWLAPGSAGLAELQLPAGTELIDLRLDGVRAAARWLAPRAWLVEVAAAATGQRLEAVFHRPAGSGGLPSVVDCPRLAGLDDVPELWSLASPPGYEVVLRRGAEIPAWRGAVLRLSALTQSRGDDRADAEATGAGGPSAWRSRWSAAYARARRAVAAVSDSEEALAARTELEAAAGGLADELTMVSAQDQGTDTTQRWELAGWESARPESAKIVRHYRLRQSAGPLPIAVRPVLAWRRLAEAAGWMLAVLVALVLARRWSVGLGTLIRRFPLPLGLALGLAWWLWLWPSVLGIGWAALAVARWLGPPATWKRRQPWQRSPATARSWRG